MKTLLIALLALLTVSCAHASKDTQVLDFTQSVPGLSKEIHDINLKLDLLIEQRTFYKMAPSECFEDGVFNENLGHDTLDCGNLEQLVNYNVVSS